jgi:hypothetical protein
MRRSGDRNVVARNRSNMVCKSTSPWAAARSNAASVPTTFKSTLPSYSHSVSFVHQQKDGLQFGRKRIASRSPGVEMGQSRIDGLFQAHYFQPLGRLRNPRAHDSWRICMGQLGPHSGRDKSLSIQVWKNAGCLDKYEVVQGSRISYDRLHLQAE